MAGGSNSRGLALLLLSSFFLALGLLFDHMPIIVDSQIKRNLELATNELTRTFWSQPPIDINTYYWLYPVINAHKFTNEGERIQVRKLGPFHFTSRMEKRLGPLSANKYRITYNSTRHYKLNDTHPEQLEAAGFDQELTYLNVIYAGLAGASAEMSHMAEDSLQQRLILTGAQRISDKFNESLFLNTTARQLLLGRPVPMLEAAAKLAKTSGMDSPPMSLGPDGKFGLVAIQNGSWTGPFEVYTGYQASQSSLGDLISFQGRKRLDQFTDRCSRMQTSAGELRPMPLADHQVLEVFLPQMCRIIRLLPTGSRRLPNGQTIGYKVAQADFSSAINNPENRCFCINKTRDNYCSLEGVVEIGPCSFYAPVMINVNGIRLDERITANIANWDPDLFRSDPEPLPMVVSNQHFLVLRRMGIPFHVDLTITIFIKVKRDERFRHLRTVPEVSYVPLAMVRELINIPPNLNQIFVHLESFLLLAEHLKVVFYLSSMALLCWLTGHFYTDHRPSMATPATADQASRRVQHQPLNSSLHRPVRQAPADGEALESVTEAHSTVVRQPPPAVIFSQVDKLRTTNLQKRSSRVGDLHQAPPNHQDLRGAPQRSPSLVRGQPSGALVSDDGAVHSLRQAEALEDDGVGNEPTSGAATILIDSSDLQAAAERKGVPTEGIMGHPNGGDFEQTGKVRHLIRRKNWVVKIYSNLLNMLGDIRQTINSASQLDVSSNSHQDKQLEMLAGRIDNWQRLSDTSTQATSAGGDESSSKDAIPEEPEDVSEHHSESQEKKGQPTVVSGSEETSRAQSIQSDETIINKTGGKERPTDDAGERMQGVQGMEETPTERPIDEDKARALGQMELALEFEASSGLSTSPKSDTLPKSTPKLASTRHKSARLNAPDPTSDSSFSSRSATPVGAPITVAVTVPKGDKSAH